VRAKTGKDPGSHRGGDADPAANPRSIALGDPAYQGLALSGFDRLGARPQYPSPSQLLGNFDNDSTAGLVWALQLLAVMLLIGLGGFVRAARPL
jgi:hypothetical protein